MAHVRVFMYYKRGCSCSRQCVRVSVLTRDDVSGMSKLEKFLQPKNTYCIRQVPWENIYLMMGSNNDSVVESLVKEHVHVKHAANVESVPTSRCFTVIIRCVDTRNQKYLLDRWTYRRIIY